MYQFFALWKYSSSPGKPPNKMTKIFSILRLFAFKVRKCHLFCMLHISFPSQIASFTKRTCNYFSINCRKKSARGICPKPEKTYILSHGLVPILIIFDHFSENIDQNWSIFRQFALEGLGPNLPQNHRHFKDISQLSARPFCEKEFAGDGKQNCFFAKKMWPRRRQN